MTSFRLERETFIHLRKRSTSICKHEYERAIETLLNRYNTTVFENRFVVGGALEVFTLGLLRTVGIDCKLVSDQATGADILLTNGAVLSLKSSLVGVNDIRLVNKMGEGTRNWTIATLFVVSELGIVFGTPNMINDSDIKASGDALVLKNSGLTKIISEKDNVMSLKIATKPSSELASESLKASSAIARQILYDTNSQTLLAAVGHKTS